jgi:Leucine-rich repeat (LRR) protein
MSRQPFRGAEKNADAPAVRDEAAIGEGKASESGNVATAAKTASRPTVVSAAVSKAPPVAKKASVLLRYGEEWKDDEKGQLPATASAAAAVAAPGVEKAVAPAWKEAMFDVEGPWALEMADPLSGPQPGDASRAAPLASSRRERRQELAARVAELVARGEPVDDELRRDPNEALGGRGEDDNSSHDSRRLPPPAIRPPAGGLFLQDRVGSEPGAFRVIPGQSIERAWDPFASEELSDDLEGAGEFESDNQPRSQSGAAARAAYQGSGNGAQDGTDGAYLVEANLVSDDDDRGPAPLLVEARPIRRKRQLAIMAMVAVAVAAVIVGLSVGLTLNRPSLPTTPAPTPAPTSQLDQLFRPTLPSYTLDSLQNTSSPQYRAYEWATEVDQVPWEEAPDDEERRLARMRQRFALAALFFATGGGDGAWRNSTGWLDSTTHECAWPLCYCYPETGSSDVQWLELTSNDMAGPLPREVGILSSLKWLHLDKNLLSGSLPSEIGTLTLLQTLLLDDNLFTGALPTEIGKLTNLLYASLKSNGFGGVIPTDVGNLNKLTNLDLSDNLIRHSIPSEIGALSQLTQLIAARNALSDVVPTTLGRLANLETLDLSENFLEGAIPTEIGKMTTLQFLKLSVNRLSSSIPTQLGQLSNMLGLSASDNALTGKVPTELGNISSLLVVQLQGNRLSSTIPTEWGRLTLLVAFGLSSNALTGPIPAELGGLSLLMVASLASNTLTGTIPTALGLLTQLTEIDLGHNQLTGSIPSELCRLQDMKTVDIAVDCLEVNCSCGCLCSEDADGN